VDRTCQNCGRPVLAADVFCGNCGQSMAVGPVVNVPQPAPGGQASAAGSTAVRPVPQPVPQPAPQPVPQAVPQPGPPDAALGQATPNAQYIGRRLMYDLQPEQSFDPLGNNRLLGQLLLRGFVLWLVYCLAGFVAWIILGILVRVGLGPETALRLGIIGTTVSWLVLVCLTLFVPMPVQISEWKFFVDGKAEVAPVAFDHITWALARRQPPLDLVQVRRLNLAAGEGRDYLEMRRGMFTGLISCFGYGRDLYLGWTLWLRVSLARYILMFIARFWQVVAHRGNDMYVKLRYDYARAMREVMHSATREGVDVAVGQVRPQGQGAGSNYQVVVADVGR
jgi:hypothetical protein